MMDFSTLRRRLAFKQESGDPPRMVMTEAEEVMTMNTPAIGDGRVVEDRMTLPPIQDSGRREDSNRRMDVTTRGSSARRS